jgi:eukaryotic-like serine/threonine-protein kinase
VTIVDRNLSRAGQVANRASTAVPRQDIVPQWQLTRRLPTGGRLALYRARAAQERGPGAYVIKRPRQPGNSMAIAMLAREAAVARETSHASVVAVLAAGANREQPYVAVPYLDGVTLGRLVAGRQDIPFATSFVLSIARQIASALAALHSAGWLHGQIRGEHVIVSPQGQATVIDLTEARRLATSECDVAETRERLTSEVDTYALGVLLFEMLAGRPPFVADSPQALAACHRRERPPDVRSCRSSVSLEVNELVQRMLAKEPLRRPGDDELVRWLAELEIEEISSL